MAAATGSTMPRTPLIVEIQFLGDPHRSFQPWRRKSPPTTGPEISATCVLAPGCSPAAVPTSCCGNTGARRCDWSGGSARNRPQALPGETRQEGEVKVLRTGSHCRTRCSTPQGGTAAVPDPTNDGRGGGRNATPLVPFAVVELPPLDHPMWLARGEEGYRGRCGRSTGGASTSDR